MTFRDMFDLTDYISWFLWSFETLRFWTLLHLIARYHKHLLLTFGLKMAIYVGFCGDFLYFSAWLMQVADLKQTEKSVSFLWYHENSETYRKIF